MRLLTDFQPTPDVQLTPSPTSTRKSSFNCGLHNGGGGSSHGSNNALDDDDDTEMAGVPPKPDFQWQDEDLHAQTLHTMNQMRKNKHFCDVTLQTEKQELPAHRCVLASASPYLLELFTSQHSLPSRKETEGATGIVYQLNSGFDTAALERLIEYAYTGRLDMSADLVKPVYVTAVRLRMERAARACAHFLASNIDLETCLEWRNMPGLARLADLSRRVDDFIRDNMDQLHSSRALMALPRICVEVLHATREEKEAAQAQSLCSLVLDWVQSQWLEDDNLTVEAFAEKKHLLYMGNDNALRDCQDIEEGSPNDSEIIQDYKKSNQQQVVPKQKVRRHQKISTTSAPKPVRPRELLYSRQINHHEDDEHLIAKERSHDWKLIACSYLESGSILAVALVNGQVVTFSLIPRINRPSSPSAGNLNNLNVINLLASVTAAAAASDASNHTSPCDVADINDVTLRSKSPPTISSPSTRPSSLDKDVFAPVASMGQAKCAVGTGNLDGQLVVCGGFDRGECLNTVSLYNPDSNSWIPLEPMLSKRGRFDITVLNNKVIYAVAGSNGQAEIQTAEKYEDGKWKFVASLPVPVSSTGLCDLDGTVYCIGGTYGQSGNKHCFRLVDGDSKWERIASLNIGRSQAAVTAFQGKLWVVGGCDTWNPFSSVEVYDPATNSWKMGPPMNTPRRGCGLVQYNGLLYVIGGCDGTYSLCTTEIYDPRVNLWTAGPSMTTCRGNVSVTVVGDKIWAIGGFSGKVFLNTAEYLDPTREEWTHYIPTISPLPAGSTLGARKKSTDSIAENGHENKTGEEESNLTGAGEAEGREEAEESPSRPTAPVTFTVEKVDLGNAEGRGDEKEENGHDDVNGLGEQISKRVCFD